MDVVIVGCGMVAAAVLAGLAVTGFRDAMRRAAAGPGPAPDGGDGVFELRPDDAAGWRPKGWDHV